MRGFQLLWKPRPKDQQKCGSKTGDLYVWPPDSKRAGATRGGKCLRSLSALIDLLTIRHEARVSGGAVWTPPLRAQLFEVWCEGTADDADEDADEAAAAPCGVWRRCEVVRTHENGSFCGVLCDDAAADAWEAVWAAENQAAAEAHAAAEAQAAAEAEAAASALATSAVATALAAVGDLVARV